MTGYECYEIYIAMKLHFSSESYDAIKFQGKVRANAKSFNKRNDTYIFEKMGKKYKKDELIMFFIANFVDDNKYIKDLLNEDANERYKEMQKILQSMSYVFSNDVDYILSYTKTHNINFDDLFYGESNDYPILLKMAMQKDIHLETFIVLNKVLNFLPDFDKRIRENYVWPDFRNKFIKYGLFINADKEKYLKILKDKIKEYSEEVDINK